jgi:pyruvate dehydrogenase E2 component (dihydrolipoamide acetyltransferase)
MGEFRMPALGADMEAGTVVEWLVKPGDEVHRGQIVAVVDTAKSAIEIEVFEDGVVDEILVPLDEEVPVGTVLARLRAAQPVPAAPADGHAAAEPPQRPAPAGSAVPPSGSPAPSMTALAPSAGSAVPSGDLDGASGGSPARREPSPVLRALAHRLGVDITTVVGSGARGRILRADIERAAAAAPAAGPPPRADDGRRPPSSPLARRRAAERGIDLALVHGTGPGGAVIAADVDAAVSRAEPATAAATGAATGAATAAATGAATEAPSAGPAAGATAVTASRAGGRAATDRYATMRRAIGDLMSRSKREIPHYYLATTIDLGAAMTWLQRHNDGVPVAERLVPAALLLKATALAAHEISEMNGHFVDGEFRRAGAVRLGVPVSLRGGGLLTPAIDHAEELSLDVLMEQLRDVVSRAKAGRLRGSELADPTLTVTNLGDRGVEAVFGVIYPPQVALVGFGTVVERPWAVDGLLGVRPVVTATLAADHRVSDGHRGALFLTAISDRLQQPEAL